MRCAKCNREPKDIPEYRDDYKEYGASSPDAMAREDGTFNPDSNSFVCTECYVGIGCPSSPHGWTAP